jgi:hypothetical protein
MSLRKRQPDPTLSDPSAVGQGDPSAMGLDPTALGDPGAQAAPAGPPDAAPPQDTGGLSNEALANIDLSAAGAAEQGAQPQDPNADPNAMGQADLQDPEVAALLDAALQGDPQAMQMLDLAARRRVAGV